MIQSINIADSYDGRSVLECWLLSIIFPLLEVVLLYKDPKRFGVKMILWNYPQKSLRIINFFATQLSNTIIKGLAGD